MLRVWLIALVVVCAACAGCASVRRPMAERADFAWTTPDGAVWTHRAVVERPEAELDNGWAVMLFSGGLSADLDWTVPGAYEADGRTRRLTIDGEATRDGLTLAQGLRAAGFTVLRYSSVREGDALRARSPVLAEAVGFPATVTMAEAAWASLVSRAGVEPGRVLVVGHSLGAARGVLTTDGEAAGYVFLAGAYVTPTDVAPARLAREAGAEPTEEPGEDYDRSGAVVGWERAAARAIRTGSVRTGARWRVGGASLAWPIDVLAGGGAPVLAVWGGEDATSYHGPVLERLLGDRVETVYLPGLGHNLGPVEDGRSGAIDAGVARRVVAWCAERAEGYLLK